MAYTPEHELEVNNALAKELKDLKVIFDVGARDDIEYLSIYPEAEYHLFEPNPVFFERLLLKVKDLPNVHANCFGLADMEGEFGYADGLQTTSRTGRFNGLCDRAVSLRTLDSYIAEHNISEISLLKTDTEGGDDLVFLGGKTAFPITKFIQYEHWDNMPGINSILSEYFEPEYMGYRNVLCINKKLVASEEKDRIVKYIRDNKLGELV